jgi:dTDP-4-dehydrorhamnose 3,5-epimerase
VTVLRTQPVTPSAERGIRWDDPAISIEWPLQPTHVADRDLNWPNLRQPG